MLIDTVTEHRFHDGLQGDNYNFSYEARDYLYNYLWDLSEDLGENMEFDPIAIRCQYSEVNKDEIVDYINSNYFVFGDTDENGDGIKYELKTVDEVVEWLQDRTSLVAVLENGNLLFDYNF